VHLGDTISVAGRIREKRELDAEHGLVSCDLRIRNQHGELVARARVEALWRRVERGAIAVDPDPVPAFVPIPL
jgi:acyl dehydratase